MLQFPHVLLTFDKVQNPLRLPHEATSEPPKVVRTPVFCLTFWLQNVLRAKRRALFRHLNFQKWSEPLVFLTNCEMCFAPQWRALFPHLNFEMCFAPQWRALFRHRNFQKCSETQVFCTFWLANVLRATTACNFSSLIWPAGSAPAALASLLFRPSGATNHWKNMFRQCFATFLPFHASASSFSSTLLSSNLSLLSASSLLCFSSVHTVGSLISKLLSMSHPIKMLNTSIEQNRTQHRIFDFGQAVSGSCWDGLLFWFLHDLSRYCCHIWLMKPTAPLWVI